MVVCCTFQCFQKCNFICKQTSLFAFYEQRSKAKEKQTERDTNMFHVVKCISQAFRPQKSLQYHKMLLLIEVTYVLICHPCQYREELGIRLGRL